MSRRTIYLPLSRLGTLLLLFALLTTFAPVSRAQSDARYFPETGHFLQGTFRAYWEQNGGVTLFGYPITEEYIREDGRVVQWFERARFELIIRDGQAFVEPGNLGVEITAGRVFPKVPPIPNTESRRYIPETQHIVQYGFKTIWERYGEDRIFGFPISEEIDEVLEDGQWHTVQYFERARFEYWPERADGDRVLFSNLGRMLAPVELTAPLPPDAPPQQPQPPAQQPPAQQPPAQQPPAQPQASLPPGVNARVIPEMGPPGTAFRLEASGFAPDERVGVWATSPDGQTIDSGFQVEADDEGAITHENVTIQSNDDFMDGIWSLNARGVSSGNEAIGYFRISRGMASAPQPEPTTPQPTPVQPEPANPAPAAETHRLGHIVHDQLPPPQGNAFMLPVAGPPGAIFELTANGYQPGEEIQSWLSGPNNNNVPIDPAQVSLGSQGEVRVRVESANLTEGTYTVVAQGSSSNVVGAASFRVTSAYVAGPGTPRPPNMNGSVTPQEGGLNTIFQIRGQNLWPNESLELWITEPGGTYALFPDNVNADEQGRVGYSPTLDLQATTDFVPGVYGIHFRGQASRIVVSVYFTYNGPASSGILSQPVIGQMIQR
jgi:hypothetical protein